MNEKNTSETKKPKRGRRTKPRPPEIKDFQEAAEVYERVYGHRMLYRLEYDRKLMIKVIREITRLNSCPRVLLRRFINMNGGVKRAA